MEREKEELERKLAKEKERRAKLGQQQQHKERPASVISNAPPKVESPPETVLDQMPEGANLASAGAGVGAPPEKETQRVSSNEHEVVEPENGNAMGSKMGHEQPEMGIVSPPSELIQEKPLQQQSSPVSPQQQQQKQNTNNTFQGGEIRFANPFGGSVVGKWPPPPAQ
jgi:hypothetical protein